MARLRSKIFMVGATILMQLLVPTFAATLFAQELSWVESPTGNGQGFGIAVDLSGNSYVTGVLAGNVFVAKYVDDKVNNNGTLAWLKSVGNGNGRGIAVDGSGNSYVTGTYSGTLTFPGVTLTAVGGNDIFVASYDIDGNFRWAKSAGGTGDEQGKAIAVDGSGNSYVTGQLGGSDLFVAKYDSTGTLVWPQSAGGAQGFAIAVDASRNSYVTGTYSGTLTFPGVTLTAVGGIDVFVASYDIDGNFRWATSMGGDGPEQGFGIAVDGSGNNIYVTGVDSDTPGVTSGAIFVAKFECRLGTNCNNQLPKWTTYAAGTGDGGFGIALDGSGYIYVAGNHSGDIFVAKFVDEETKGTLAWLKNAGSTAATNETGFGIGVDSSGNRYVTGRFQEGTAGPPLIQRSLVKESRMKPNSLAPQAATMCS